ncbi:unnamed protein product [Heterobilharzia americana]|nr:unnamed protein product [Heterobilharzia americana]
MTGIDTEYHFSSAEKMRSKPHTQDLIPIPESRVRPCRQKTLVNTVVHAHTLNFRGKGFGDFLKHCIKYVLKSFLTLISQTRFLHVS